MQSDPAFTLHYRVERVELWNYYWSAWRRVDGLWQYWLLWLALTALPALALAEAFHFDLAKCLFIAALLYVAGVCFFVIFPQAKYKPQERTLVVGGNGIDTSIGYMTAHREWEDIARVIDRGDYIALVVAGGVKIGGLPVWIRTRNGNAFIVPNRAFANPQARAVFLESSRAWHQQHALRFPRLANSRFYG